MSISKSVVGLAAAALAFVSLASSPSAEANGPRGPVPGKPGDSSIVEIAQGAGIFGTLLAAADAAGLAGTLANDGPFTVFAPTDEAFAKLPEGTIELLLANPDVLADILTYHVVPGRRFSNSVFNANAVKPVRMLNGQFVLTNPGFTVNDNAGQAVRIIEANINASNGVIHIIDTVLLPFVP